MADVETALPQEAINTAMKDPDHLKRWLLESGRPWLVFNSKDLIDALPWPSGAQALSEIIASYRDHRRTIATGRTEIQQERDDVTGQAVSIEIQICKDEPLEIEELDRAIRHLIGLATEKDPGWSLTNTPL